jgi:hypothetical protein
MEMSMTASELSPGVWTNPDGLFSNVFIVTTDSVLYGKVNLNDQEQLTAALADRRTLTSLPFERINRIRMNKRNCEVSIQTGQGKERKTVNLELGNDETRSAFFDAIKAGVGPSWTERFVERSAASAAIGPAITAVVFTGLTVLAYLGARSMQEGESIESSGRYGILKRLFYWLMETLGPSGVAVVGGLLVLITLAVLIGRMRKPPKYVELKPE